MYYLLLILLYPLSLLPLGVLYLISDLAFVLLYHITGYRKDVVMDNLRHAFPEKGEAELKKVMRRFYRCFCDQWIETLKLLSISRSELDRRFGGNWEVFEDMAAKGKNVYLMSGHTFNWEWANVACHNHSPQQYACVYLPLTSTGFDKLMLRIRTRTGAWMISMKALKSGLKKLQGVQFILGLAGDQNPSDTDVAFWVPFMHREAPFFRGGEQMARRSAGAVVFAGIRKVKRGHYRILLQPFTEDASQTGAGEITRAYVSFIEKQLQEQPENYLWSHRRWKHQQKAASRAESGV